MYLDDIQTWATTACNVGESHNQDSFDMCNCCLNVGNNGIHKCVGYIEYG